MTNKIIYTHFQDKALEAHVDKELKSIEHQALGDITIASAKSIDPKEIAKEVDAKIYVTTTSIMKALQPLNQRLEASLQQLRIETKREDINRQRDIIENESRGLRIDLDRMGLSYPWRWYFVPIAFIAATCAADSLSNYTALQVILPNLLVSIVMVVLLAAALGIAAHLTGSKAREAHTKTEKWAWLLGGMAGAFIVFLGLGILRGAFLESTGAGSLSPFWIAAWNTAFFVVAAIVSLRFMPTTAQYEERRKYQEKKVKLVALQKADTILKNEMEKEEAEYVALIKKQKAMETYESDLLKQVEAQRLAIHATLNKEFSMRSNLPQPKVIRSLPTHSIHQSNYNAS